VDAIALAEGNKVCSVVNQGGFSVKATGKTANTYTVTLRNRFPLVLTKRVFFRSA